MRAFLKKEITILLAIGLAAAVIFGPLWWRPVSPCVLGDFAARSQAKIPEALKDIYFDAEQIQFGFGTAAIGEWQGLGDSVVANGMAWVRNTNRQSPKYYNVVSNRYFQSNALVYLPRGYAFESAWQPSQVMSLPQLWEALTKKYPNGAVFVGYLRLTPLRLMAIARPAIDNRGILKNAPYYYTHPLQSSTETWAYVVGVAAGSVATDRIDRRWLGDMLETGSTRAPRNQGLMHALVLKSAPVDFQAPPQRAEIIGVGQLVADSAIAAGELKLYPISRAGNCDSAVRAN